jgi:enterochelin esterase-like enzyme
LTAFVNRNRLQRSKFLSKFLLHHPARLVFVLTALMIVGCDPMAPQPVVVVITDTPTYTPTPFVTATPTSTRTPIPTETPDFTATPTPFPCGEDGTLDELSLSGDSAQESITYSIYVPPCYGASVQRFPVLYLLHDLDQTGTQWQDIGLIEALNTGIRLGALPPMIVVMPNGGDLSDRNNFPPETSYETVLQENLVSAVERDFCTINTAATRAIGGIGRGGFWAYSLALRNPDVFGIVGGHSADFTDDLDEVPAAVNPLELARNSTLLPEANLQMYLDNGAADFTAANQKLFSDRLTARSIPHIYILNTVGDHDNDYWASHLTEYLEFYSRRWERNYSALPSCLEPSPS